MQCKQIIATRKIDGWMNKESREKRFFATRRSQDVVHPILQKPLENGARNFFWPNHDTNRPKLTGAGISFKTWKSKRTSNMLAIENKKDQK